MNPGYNEINYQKIVSNAELLETPNKELGCNKIALGHYFDDVIETILMGML